MGALVALGVSAVVAFAASPAGRAAVRDSGSVRSSAQTPSLLAAMNVLRRRHGVAPLHASSELAAAARAHSAEMARDGYFAHESRDGTSLSARIVGFYPLGVYSTWSVGENLAWASPDLGVARTIGMWLHSPTHRENLFAPQWREAGIAAVHVESAPRMFGGEPVTVVTADFGVRR